MRPHVVHWLEQYLRADLAGVLAPSWFTCVGLAGVMALMLMLVLARRRGIDRDAMASVVLWGYAAAVAAGIVVPMLIDAGEHFVTTLRLRFQWAGMTSFWGYLAGAIAVAVACRRERLPLAEIADLAVIPLGIALVLARLGCFMAGCDYGKVSSLPWAVRFPAGSPAWRDHVHAGLIPADRAESLPVHPTQLYEAVIGIAIVVLGIVLARRAHKAGHKFFAAAALYAIGRLAVETLRGDAGRGIHAGLSSGQIFSLLVLVAIAARHVVVRRRAVTALAAAALALAVAGVGEADAQPPGAIEPEPQPDLAERPQFFAGLLGGIATPLNRRADQVPTLAGPTLSLGYLPGRLGVWLDIDSFASSDATHGTLLIAGSFTHKLSRNFIIGARLGLGATRVNFKDPAFIDVVGKTVRMEMIAEWVLARHWSIWMRPFSVDTLFASDLGGPITTYQFRLGFTYRWGSRRNAIHVQPLPPLDPDPPPTVGVR